MDFNNEPFEVEFTDECIEEIIEIYEYISNQLKENNAAKRLMTEVTDRVLDLANSPELYMKIGKVEKVEVVGEVSNRLLKSVNMIGIWGDKEGMITTLWDNYKKKELEKVLNENSEYGMIPIKDFNVNSNISFITNYLISLFNSFSSSYIKSN